MEETQQKDTENGSMNEHHQSRIEQYREHLIEHTNFDALWETLTNDNFDNILPDYMVEDILSTPDGCERNERFYNLVQTCGHHLSFRKLCNALSASGQNDLSRLLMRDKLLCNPVVDASRTNKYPNLPPLLDNVKVCRRPVLSQWGITRMKDPKYSYYVQSSPRGYLLLVNNRFVMNPLEDERLGSEVDVKNLKNLFSQLDYKIVEYHNLILAEMDQALHDFSHMKELSDVDSVIVFVMSHGSDPSKRKPNDPPLKSPGRESVDITLEDNLFINSNDIVDAINHSPTIKSDTPKLFFFNVCRGKKIYKGSGDPQYPVSVDSTAHAQTCTEIDAQPYTRPHTPPTSVSNLHSNENNVPRNENNVPRNENNLPSNENNVPSNRISENNVHSNGISQNNVPGNENHLLSNGISDTHVLSNDISDNHVLSDELVPLSYETVPLSNGLNYCEDSVVNQEETLICCCFYKYEDKRKNLLVRVAVWFARKMKCSMPTGEREEVNSHPAGVPSSTEAADSPDSELPPFLWPENMTETAQVSSAGILRTESKASSNHSYAGSLKNRIVQGLTELTHKKRSEPKPGDVYMGFSTIDGYNSKRHPSRGSWFVTLICQVFAEQAKDTDLLTMMEDVDRRMREMNDAKYGTQMYVKKTEGFSKKFFFNVRDTEES